MKGVFWEETRLADRIHIIGIGDNGANGLTQKVGEIISQAEIIFGGERHLSFFPALSARKVVVKSNLKEIAEEISQNLGKKRIVVLASGDPLFYGIAKYLMAKIPKEKFEIIPYLSSMQVAFAKVKETWEDATLISLHAKPIDNLLEAAATSRKLGIFTDEENSPARIAKALLENGVDGFSAYVCENLEGEDERISAWDLPDLVSQKFSPLNVLILVKKAHEPVNPSLPAPVASSFGIPDHQFFQRMPQKGLITKWEVRVISLARLNLKGDAVLWDIGAGSGSVSVEAARFSKQVVAIEKNLEDCQLIAKNAERFGTKNVSVVHGQAPEILEQISEDPDSVFIGGSSGSMGNILEICAKRLKPAGSIVVNAATFENLSEALAGLRDLRFSPEVTLVQVSRSKPILDLTRLEALNPVYVIWGRKS